MQGSPEGDELLDPVVEDRKRYKKNAPSFLSCIGKKIREVYCTMMYYWYVVSRGR